MLIPLFRFDENVLRAPLPTFLAEIRIRTRAKYLGVIVGVDADDEALAKASVKYAAKGVRLKVQHPPIHVTCRLCNSLIFPIPSHVLQLLPPMKDLLAKECWLLNSLTFLPYNSVPPSISKNLKRIGAQEIDAFIRGGVSFMIMKDEAPLPGTRFFEDSFCGWNMWGMQFAVEEAYRTVYGIAPSLYIPSNMNRRVAGLQSKITLVILRQQGDELLPALKSRLACLSARSVLPYGGEQETRPLVSHVSAQAGEWANEVVVKMK